MFEPLTILANLADPFTLALMALSACFGIIMGAVPGLSGTLGIALLLPFTFGLDPATALLMLGSVYCGSEYGGSIPAILINTPGTAAALCTTFDGYPMAMKGQAQKALFTALISSVFGGLFGVSALIFLSLPLAAISMQFGAPEQFWLCVFALTIIASLSSGNVLKGILGALLGLVLACVGMDPITGHPRFTFNTMELMGGISVVPALIGLFAIPQALLLLKPADTGEAVMAPYISTPGVFLKTLREFLRRIWVVGLAGVIGVIVGI
ncbi:MAG: tripartite tricarboxylate transporter permease, partial [Desulfovibrio sp.]|nr:tripartite tricarboxylate transporter permease [Desulfovibrio sp.]